MPEFDTLTKAKQMLRLIRPQPARTLTDLTHLVQKIRAIEQRTGKKQASQTRPRMVLHTGWPQVDRMLNRGRGEWGGGEIHEWFGLGRSWSEDPNQQHGGAQCRGVQGRGAQYRGAEDGGEKYGGAWVPPVFVLAHMAWQAVCQAQPNGQRLVMWIGRRCWPHLGSLIRFRSSGCSADWRR